MGIGVTLPRGWEGSDAPCTLYPQIIKNLDFSLDLVHFLAQVGGAGGGLKPFQLNIPAHKVIIM